MYDPRPDDPNPEASTIMLRTFLATGLLSGLLLTTACQSGPAGGTSSPAPAPETPPTEAPDPPNGAMEPDDAPAEEAEETPMESPAPGAVDGDAPAVVLDDGRNLMSLDGLPPRPTGLTHPELPSGDATTADGVYSLEQAARGAELVKTTCAECHDPEDWRERGFLARWSGESTYQLWYYINDRMPYRNPWSLTRQQVTDALAYILYVNELPHGAEEMGTTEDDIDDYWIVW